MIHDPTLTPYQQSVARFFGGRMPTREALAAMENRAMWDITGRANNWHTFARVQNKTIARPRPVCNKAPIPPTDVRCIRILKALPATCVDLAAQLHLSEDYTGWILRTLRREGLVKPVRQGNIHTWERVDTPEIPPTGPNAGQGMASDDFHKHG